MPLTKIEKGDIIEPNKLYLGFDKVLRYAYCKGKRRYTKSIVRVVDGIVYIQDPSTKDQIECGKALWVGNVLVMALSVHREG